jgi:RNA polymerase sigma-70 factor (ECF subfamily)
MVTPSDRELALNARAGDRQAFGELALRYQATVFNVCFRLMGERRQAEDMTQEAFIRAYQHFNQYDLERPFGAWIRRVAANLCLNHMQTPQPIHLALEDERDDAGATALEDPEASREWREYLEDLHSALVLLPPMYRAVIELRHYQELSYAEIAKGLKIPLSDVKSHLFRARQILAKRLKSYAE